jgi:hypothetical protein
VNEDRIEWAASAGLAPIDRYLRCDHQYEGNQMGDRHAGSCLCGEVRFEVEGVFEKFFLCHCEYCRKDTGSAHAANLFSKTATLTWLSGEDKTTFFNLPATRHCRRFCSTCGSALPYSTGGKYLIVPAGSLDTDVSIRPDAHIFVASKANWDDGLEEVVRIDHFPG